MPKTKPISFKAAAKRRREAQAPPPSVPGFERVMPFRDWCALKGFSVLTGQRLRKEGRIRVVRLSATRLGVTESAEREYMAACESAS
jgi:hypothetical protein